jgi:hypothetical protein
VAAQATTDASGSFRLGPLYSDTQYTVQLSKTGHIITPPSINTSPAAAGSATDSAEQLLQFFSKQLASVAVSVELPAGTSPSAVFLSLSGSGGFKSNARLGPDSTLTFQDLQPDTYYLKPLLREHQFEPPVADLALEDGQAATVTLRAVRSAWGISGAVASGKHRRSLGQLTGNQTYSEVIGVSAAVQCMQQGRWSAGVILAGNFATDCCEHVLQGRGRQPLHPA